MHGETGFIQTGEVFEEGGAARQQRWAWWLMAHHCCSLIGIPPSASISTALYFGVF